MNGNMNGDLPHPTPTPVPTVPQAVNGELPSPSKSVKWGASEKEMLEIQRAGAAIGELSKSSLYQCVLYFQQQSTKICCFYVSGLNGRTASSYMDYNDTVKFISLASPLSSADGVIMNSYKTPLHLQQRELGKPTGEYRITTSLTCGAVPVTLSPEYSTNVF